MRKAFPPKGYIFDGFKLIKINEGAIMPNPLLPEWEKECSMSLNEALHYVRNPYGHSKEKVKFAKELLCGFVERTLLKQQEPFDKEDNNRKADEVITKAMDNAVFDELLKMGTPAQKELVELDEKAVLDTLQEVHWHIVNQMLAKAICQKFGTKTVVYPEEKDEKGEWQDYGQCGDWEDFAYGWNACLLKMKKLNEGGSDESS